MLFLNTSQDALDLLPHKGNKARGLALLLLTIFPLLFGCFALFLGQDTNWDFRNYHWYNAYALLNDRYGFDLFPSQIPYFYNPAMDVPFFLLGTHFSAVTAGFILGTVQGLNFVLLFMLCHMTLIIHQSKQKVVVCAALALLGMLGGGSIAQIGTSFYDNITSLGLFTSAILVIRFYKKMLASPMMKALGIAFLCGFPAGLMMGFKLPFVTFCVGLCGALLFVTGPFLRRVWIAFGFGLGVLVGLSLSFGPWGYHLYQEFGNPLFPYFNDIFKSPLAPEISARDTKFIPSGFWDRILFPYIFSKHPMRVGEIPWHDVRIAVLYTLLPVCILIRLAFGRNKNAPDKLTTYIAGRYLLWAAGLSYLVWLFIFAIYRYALPLEMISPLLIVVIIGLLPTTPQRRALITAFILGFIALNVDPGDWGRKKPWLEKPVVIDVPAIEYPANTMMLMAGLEPYSHVVPAFPPEMPFVRIDSNFARPTENKGINIRFRERINNHTGIFKMLVPNFQINDAVSAADFFGLVVNKESCTPVTDYLYDSSLILCDVKRRTKEKKP